MATENTQTGWDAFARTPTVEDFEPPERSTYPTQLQPGKIMLDSQIPPSALGHLCDDFGAWSAADWEKAVKETAAFIQGLLPNHSVSHSAEWSASNEYDFFCEPPLTLEEARAFEVAIRDWARPKKYDYCPCYVLMRIDELAKEAEE